ncbi:MAG: phosphatidylserine decarboxylase, partial [Acidobacteriaceae bacterium]
RDPKRAIPQEPGLVVSPADGKVTEVARVSTPAGGLLRISIFLSVFDVHVNRSPVAGILREVRYKKGQYLNAMNPASAEHNEQNLARMECDDGTQVSFIQIAGLLARRIVFNKKVGDVLERGERVGLIKFGSRTDVLLPDYAEPLVKPGDRVRGGSSVIARLPEAEFEPLLAAADAEMSI